MLKKSSIGFIGAPCEVGACFKGAGLAPDALRQSSLIQTLEHAGYDVTDWGDIKGPTFIEKDHQTSGQLLQENVIWTKSILSKVTELYKKGDLPVVIGGDHAIAMGTIMAASIQAKRQDKPLHVIWFDAHADFNVPETSETGHIHGMPLAVVCGEGNAELIKLSPVQPAVAEENVTLLGIRDIDPGELQRLHASSICFVPMPQIRKEGILPFIERALARAKESGAHLHVSFDVDGIDEKEAPATGTPVEDGITIVQMEEAFDAIRESGLMQSLEVVELNPLIDAVHNHTTTKITRQLIERLFIPVDL